MKKSPISTKAERRERKTRPQMKVNGTSVKQLQRIIIQRRQK